MKAIARLRMVLFYVFEVLAIAAFVTMLCSSLLQVFFRHVLSNPLMWTEELARLMLVITTYLGSVVVLIAREHIRVEIIDSVIRGRAIALVAVFIDFLIIAFLLAVAIGSWRMANVTWNTGTATIEWLRMGYIYAVVFASILAMVIVLLLDIVERSVAAFRPIDGGN